MKFFLFVLLALTCAIASACSSAPANSADAILAETTPEPTPVPANDAASFLAEGNRLLDENLTDQAIAAYEKALELDPDLADAHFQLGIAYALLDMQRAQSGAVVPEETPANSKAAIPKTKSETEFEKAVKAYEKWLDKNPKDDSAFFNLGRTYSKLLKDEDAAKAFKEAVKLKPDDTEYQTELGAVHIKLAQFYEAIGPLKKAVELDPSNARAQELLEDAQAGRQRMEYAKREANQAVNSNRAVPNGKSPGSNTNSNSNSAPNPPSTIPKPVKDDPKPKVTPRP